ncbi:uncharacterized protein LOC111247292 isoform X1 [Varroa destructor]|uniref:Uncharacterized protein n=2 Tax=Varroa TaxID=62624 RepID=A0A7M7M6S6_VARDE|nr:uncharacterized protein LOC111247292 isoform X1 [Varroa destructor]XP_022653760.1 uncharacterized protein LOC111247292 isoform X1 [Varroa destructor]
MDEIRRCGGRIIFMDIESPTISALRNPREVDTSIFKHEINFAQLKHLQVLCGLLNRSQGYPLTDYCEENPQKEILSALARKVELHFNFSSSGFFGRRLKTEDYDFHEREKSFYLHQGKYNGLIGDLQQRLFDINVVSVFPSEDLQDAITFASSYYRFDQLTFFAPPAIMEFGSLKTIWMPFKPDVWACVIAMIIGVSSIMAIFVKLKFGKTWFSYNLFYMSQPMTARLPVIPRQFHRVLPIYILLAAWLLGSYLISMFYSGVLTSFRQHPRTTPVIDTFQALEAILSQQSKRSSTSTTCSGDCMAVAVLNDTKYRAILKSEGGSSYLDLARKHLTYCSKVEQCIDLVIQRKHVFLSSDYTMKWYVGTDPKNGVVQRAKDNINAGRLSITLQKGSPIQNQVTRINQQLFELGAFEKIVALEEYQLKPIYNKTNLIPPSSVMTTTDMRGLFELFAMGSFFSLLAALLERLL